MAFEDYESMILGAIMIGTMVFMRRGLFVSLLDLIKARRRA